jgi:hypothetical protein
MQVPRTRRRSGIGLALLLAASPALGGCFPTESGGNIADAYEDFAGFCGFLQHCGSDSDTNRGGHQTASGSSSDDSSSGSTSTGGQSTTGGE